MSEFAQIVRFVVVVLASFATGMVLVIPVESLITKLNSRKHIAKEGTPIFNQLHAQKEGTPVMAGIMIWGTVVLLSALFALFARLFDGFWGQLSFMNRSQTWLPLALMVLAALVGAADDVMGILRVWGKNGFTLRQRLLLFFGVALIGAWWFAVKLQWDVLHIPFLGDITVGVLPYALFFICVVMATSFALDLTDGLDGLSAGVALVTLSCLSVVAFAEGKFDLMVFTGCIIGALIAFLWFNIYPARFFIGDTGVMSLGVVIAVIALLTNTALLLPLFGFIMVAEGLSDVIQLTSKKLFKQKVFISAPIHHHFEAKGWPEPRVTMRFWIISAMAAGFGMIVFFVDKFLLR